MTTDKMPSVYDNGNPKRNLCLDFINAYHSQFDTGADNAEMFTDMIADLLHLLVESEIDDLELDPAESKDVCDFVLEGALSHWVEESPYFVELPD